MQVSKADHGENPPPVWGRARVAQGGRGGVNVLLYNNNDNNKNGTLFFGQNTQKQIVGRGGGSQTPFQ